ncbi:DUF4476 domain-containing protein [Nafulsella turpanensis]|uniref:DUF4476 domain-containing protein n=1 Tax=Nafulsella turpanensis TaxID=1265690 RepID=UPI00135F1522|nr:DUF4476 domain-containing protein [Nafulsella turpanensis]
MKKIIVFLFTGIMLLAQEVVAAPAEARFMASKNERIQLIIDGDLINLTPLSEVYIRERPGKHRVHIKVFDRWGRVKMIYTDEVLLRPHSRNSFILKTHPFKGSSLLRIAPEPYHEKIRRPGARKDYPEARRSLLNDEEYHQLLDQLKYQQNDQAKLHLVKSRLKNKLLYAADVQEMLYQFSFEQSRLHLAKWAYRHVTDPENYEVVYKALRLEASHIQLENFISRSHSNQRIR